MEENQIQSGTGSFRWMVFVTVALTYFIIFSQRTAPGIITDRIMQEFQITASTLGLLAGIQYFAYMTLQIPLGIWADRYGPYRFLLFGTLLDGMGTILYSLAPHAGIIMASRLLVGIGDAMIWINIVLVLSEWFQPREFASLLGWTGMAGNLGSIATTVPLAYWIAAQGWRIPFFSLGLFLLAVAVLIYYVLIKKGKQMKATEHASKKGDPISVRVILRRVVRARHAWATFFTHFGLVGTYLGFIGSWAMPYLMQVYGLTRSSAGQLISLGLVGALLGGPIAGFLSDKIGSRKRVYVMIHLVTFLSWSTIMLTGAKPPLALLVFLLFIIGFGNGGSMLTFAVVRDSFERTAIGVASGFANTGGFLSAVTLPPLFGFVLDHFAAKSQMGELVSTGYQYGFLVPAVFSFFGVLGALAIREHGQHTRKL